MTKTVGYLSQYAQQPNEKNVEICSLWYAFVVVQVVAE